MANKRISRSRKRELDAPDEFLTFSGKLLKFIGDNKKNVVVGAAIAAALILIVSGLRYYSFQTEKKAFALYEKAIKKIEIMGQNENPKQIYAAAGEDFKIILDQYADKKAAKIACFVFAGLAYSAEELDSAIALYERSLNDFKDDPLYSRLILTNLALAAEQKKNYENAMRYLKTPDTASDPPLQDEALFHLGRIYEKANPGEKENEYYKKIPEMYPDSIYAGIAGEKTGSVF